MLSGLSITRIALTTSSRRCQSDVLHAAILPRYLLSVWGQSSIAAIIVKKTSYAIMLKLRRERLRTYFAEPSTIVHGRPSKAPKKKSRPKRLCMGDLVSDLGDDLSLPHFF